MNSIYFAGMLVGLSRVAQSAAPEIIMAKDDKGGSVVYQRARDEMYEASLRVAAAEGVITFADKPSGVISANIGGSKQQGRQARLSITVAALDKTSTKVSLATQGFQFGFKGWGDGKATKKFFADLWQDLRSTSDKERP